MKVTLMFISLAFSLLISTLFQSAQARDNQCLGKICMGMKESQVQNSLGKPLSYEKRQCGRGDLKYSQGEVSLQDGSTYRITAQSSRWRTELGIKVGDNISKAQKNYSLKRDDSSSFSIELSTGDYLTFYTDNYQKIKKIVLHRITAC